MAAGLIAFAPETLYMLTLGIVVLGIVWYVVLEYFRRGPACPPGQGNDLIKFIAPMGFCIAVIYAFVRVLHRHL